LRNLAIILAVIVLATYAFIAVNEGQKERAIRLRLPKFRKINRYEFDTALYQIRETRAKQLRVTPRSSSQLNRGTDQREDFYKDYDYLENLKTSPSTEAQPIQDASAEAQGQQPQQQENIQEQNTQVITQEAPPTMQQQQVQPQEEGLQPDQQYQKRPRSRSPLRYQQPTPQADTNNENM